MLCLGLGDLGCYGLVGVPRDFVNERQGPPRVLEVSTPHHVVGRKYTQVEQGEGVDHPRGQAVERGSKRGHL